MGTRFEGIRHEMTAVGDALRDGQVVELLIDALVLGVLRGADDYAFGILQKLEQRGDELKLREATLYPVLRCLEDKGLVDCYWRPGERGTDRKYYRITRSGRAHLEAQAAERERVASIPSRSV